MPALANRIQWEMEVIHAVEELGEVCTSDAQAIVEVNPGKLDALFASGTPAQDAANQMLDA